MAAPTAATADPAAEPSRGAGPAGDEPVAGVLSGGPRRAPQPSLLERLRERLAVRRTLAVPSDQDLDDGVEVVTGGGAPLRRGLRPDLEERRSAALRPAGMRAPDPVPPPIAMPGSGPPDRVGRPIPATAAVPARPAPPPAAPAPPAPTAPTVVPPLHGLESLRAAAVAASAAAPAARPPRPPGRITETRPEPTPSELREGRRMLVLYLLAIAVVAVVGVLSARTTTPLTTAGTPGTHAPAPATAAPTAAAGGQPATEAPSARPSASPSQAIGSGGTGWQVAQFRFGAHDTYYRVVVDFASQPGAAPTVTVVNIDPTTIQITLAGTEPSATAPAPPGGAMVTRIRVVPSSTPGATTYRFSLSRPGTARAYFIQGPVRLVIDIS